VTLTKGKRNRHHHKNKCCQLVEDSILVRSGDVVIAEIEDYQKEIPGNLFGSSLIFSTDYRVVLLAFLALNIFPDAD